MNSFNYFFSNGDMAEVSYECVDEDESTGFGAEFEIEVFLNGKNIYDDLPAETRQKIQAQVQRDWKAVCLESLQEARISRYEAPRDFK